MSTDPKPHSERPSHCPDCGGRRLRPHRTPPLWECLNLDCRALVYVGRKEDTQR